MLDLEWLEPVWELFDELPSKDQAAIVERLNLVRSFPDMYPLRRSGRMRGHRYFVARNWLVHYRRRADTIYVRSLWPAWIPMT
jgi:hypothetical protein